MSLFGQNNKPFSGFGLNKSSTQFGTSGGFGTAANPAQGGLFGQKPATQQTPGMFGSTPSSNASAFGNTSGFNFGQSTQQNPTSGGGMFGTSGTGGFGTTNTSTGMFGTPGGTSLFGGNNNANANPSGGMFGSTGGSTFGASASVASSGTTFKFNPPGGTDTMLKSGVSTSISTRHQCITAMKEYENKSMEELRMEDYTANRKGPQAGSVGGLFGQTPQTQASATFGGFGQNKPTAFGGTTGGFGTGTTSAFQTQTAQTTTAGAFGQVTPQQQSGGLFGQPTAPKSLFGSTTSTANTGFGGFGAQNTNTATGGLFGAQTQNKSLFGTATTQAGGLFGGTQTSTSTGFGGFGQPSSSFGTTTTQAGGLFGAKPTGFGVPTTQANSFSFGGTASQPSGGLFGAVKPTTTSTGFGFGQANLGFGQTGGGGGLFSGNKPTGFGTGIGTAFNSGGLGSGLGQTSGLFAGQTTKPLGGAFGTGFGASTAFGGMTSTGLQGAQTTLGTAQDANAQNAAVQQQLLTLANSPYGDSPLFRNLNQDGKREEVLKPTNIAAQKVALASSAAQFKVSPRPTAKIKPKPLHSLANGKSHLFEGLEEDESFGNDTFVPRRSMKKLVIRNSDRSSQSSFSTTVVMETPSQLVHEDSPGIRGSQSNKDLTYNIHSNQEKNESSGDDGPVTSLPSRVPQDVYTRDTPPLDDTMAQLNTKNKQQDVLNNTSLSLGQDSTEDQDPSEISDQDYQSPHPAGIKLRRQGYYCVPSLEELADMVDDKGDCWVKDFAIGREGYGNVLFPGKTNIANINFDEVVHFRRNEVTIYPDDNDKPLVGEGINKKAQVTLDCVWPVDKTTHTTIKDPDRLDIMGYQAKLEKASLKIGAKFLDYRPETGSWVFEVKHFSKYGLPDDDSEDEDSTDPKRVKALKVAAPGKKGEGLTAQQPPKAGDKPPTQDTPVTEATVVTTTTSLSAGQEVVAGRPLAEEDSDMADIMEEEFPDDESEDDMGEPLVSHLPSSHRLATTLGVHAHQLQLQKASFFGAEDNEDEGKVARGTQRGWGNQSLLRESSSPRPAPAPLPSVRHGDRGLDTSMSLLRTSFYPQQQPQQHTPRQESPQFRQTTAWSQAPTDRKKGSPDHMIIPSGMTRKKPRPLVGTRVQRSIVSLEESLMCDGHALIMDASLTRGRGCRVGWGPNWTLVHSGSPLVGDTDITDKDTTRLNDSRFSLLPTERASKKELRSSPYQVTLERIHIADRQDILSPELVDITERHLQVALEHSESSIEEGCPIFVPQGGVEGLHAHADQAQNDLDLETSEGDLLRQVALVWELCVALWGEIPSLPEEVPSGTYTEQQSRREALSAWLVNAVSRHVKREIERLKASGDHQSCAILLALLSGRQIEEACNLSQDIGGHRLALLMSQVSGGDTVRRLVRQQCDMWENGGMDSFIEEDRHRVYALLAGDLYRTSSVGPINVCQDMDWLRCMALHLWYQCQPSSSISQAVREYDLSHTGDSPNGRYAAPPLPWYLEGCHDNRIATTETQALCYHLVKLFCDRGHPLHPLLSPTTHTPSHLDYRLSWNMYRLLESLDYRHISEYHAAAVCSNYGAQLEAVGLWHWAVFILLHIREAAQRETAVRNMIGRQVSLCPDEEDAAREEFVLTRLHVPARWLYHAKATLAHIEGRHQLEAWNLLRAGEWNLAHRVIVCHLASEAIVQEDLGTLKQYLKELGTLERYRSVEGWAIGGKVYLDYITMMETLEQIRQGQPSAYELERLQCEVSSLTSRIGALQARTVTDRLCQAEMARKTARITHMLLVMGQSQDGRAERMVDINVINLPLPEDYALEELHQLTRGHLMEVASS